MTRPRRTVTSSELDAPLMSYADALETVRAAFLPLAPTRVPLTEAAGLVLAADVVSGDDIPAFDNSAMDGYAVRSADVAPAVDGVGAEHGTTTVELAVADEPGPGVAAKVMTGFPVPDGADAVVPWERAEALDGGARIRLTEVVAAGTFVRRRGEDVHAGDTVLRAGAVLGPVEIGLLAAVGAATVWVHPRVRVGVLSTGDELVGVDEPVGRGRVRDANAPMLAAACTALGATVTGTRRVGDDPDAIASALEELAEHADLVVSSGGASVGEHDWLRTVLERSGPLSFWRVALRPGKPVAVGRVADTPVVVLPGNPGSVLACTHVFVARAVRGLAGRRSDPDEVPGTLAESVQGDPARTVVHPVRVVDGRVHPAAVRSSQVISNAVGSDGWLIVAPGGLAAGTEVRVELDR
jgi:molybdopterin molybdotransferase